MAVAYSLLNLAKLRAKQGKHAEARELLGQCLAITQVEGARSLEATARYHLAEVARLCGEIEKGVALARQAWSIYQALGASANGAQAAELVSSMLARS